MYEEQQITNLSGKHGDFNVDTQQQQYAYRRGVHLVCIAPPQNQSQFIHCRAMAISL